MTYRETAPSGVEVTSTVPFKPTYWYDLPLLHPVWSYASWITMILKHGYGVHAPRRLFDRHWNHKR